MSRSLALPSLLFLLFALAPPASLRAAETGGPVWSPNVHLFEMTLTKEAAQRQMKSFSLPKLRIYDSKGRRIHSSDGYDTEFDAVLKPLFQGRGKPAKALLQSELADFRGPQGEPLAPLPPADFTVVEQWADWCVPCYAQNRQLAGLLRAYPNRTFNLLHVDSDMPKILGLKGPSPQKMEMDAESARKLEDPSLSSKERDQVVEDLMIKNHPPAPTKPKTVKTPTTKPPQRH